MEVQRITISSEDRSLLSLFMGEDPGNTIDFNWLMPVVEKIEKHGCIVELNICLATMCRITKLNGSREPVVNFINGGSISLLDATHISVVEFIKWYNSQQK